MGNSLPLDGHHPTHVALERPQIATGRAGEGVELRKGSRSAAPNLRIGYLSPIHSRQTPTLLTPRRPLPHSDSHQIPTALTLGPNRTHTIAAKCLSQKQIRYLQYIQEIQMSSSKIQGTPKLCDLTNSHFSLKMRDLTTQCIDGRQRTSPNQVRSQEQ